MPFSYPSLLASNAMRSVLVQDDVSEAEADAAPAHEEDDEAEDENEDEGKEEKNQGEEEKGQDDKGATADKGKAVKKGKKGPLKVEFGEWDLDEVQICEMGSYGTEGEYVAVASIPLV